MTNIGKLRYSPGGTLNFTENVQVAESKKPRWAKFKVVGRTGDLYAYAGAESRIFRLTFFITSPAGGNVAGACNRIRGGTTSSGGSAPTIKFSYGSMYSNIKCVCTNYSIRNIESAGYDSGQNPRRVQVILTLEEVDVPSY